MAENFAMVPAQTRALWILVASLTVLFAGILVVLVIVARGAQHSRFAVSDAGLQLRGDLYGRLIPAAAILGDSVRIVNVADTPELAPRLRTAGTSLAGYQSGWFRLRNGKKALLYLTDRSRAVHVPTTAGYSLLLSVESPERFVARLRGVARGS